MSASDTKINHVAQNSKKNIACAKKHIAHIGIEEIEYFMESYLNEDTSLSYDTSNLYKSDSNSTPINLRGNNNYINRYNPLALFFAYASEDASNNLVDMLVQLDDETLTRVMSDCEYKYKYKGETLLKHACATARQKIAARLKVLSSEQLDRIITVKWIHFLGSKYSEDYFLYEYLFSEIDNENTVLDFIEIFKKLSPEKKYAFFKTSNNCSMGLFNLLLRPLSNKVALELLKSLSDLDVHLLKKLFKGGSDGYSCERERLFLPIVNT